MYRDGFMAYAFDIGYIFLFSKREVSSCRANLLNIVGQTCDDLWIAESYQHKIQFPLISVYKPPFETRILRYEWSLACSMLLFSLPDQLIHYEVFHNVKEPGNINQHMSLS